MKTLTAPEEESVNEKFLRMWLRDPELLRREFDEIAGPLL